MLKKILMTVMSVALLLGGYCGSASAEYMHVFHRASAAYGATDVYIDFAGIQSSPTNVQGAEWTRYIVPVKADNTYSKYVLTRKDDDPKIWAVYRVTQDSPWYDLESWDNISMEAFWAEENKPSNVRSNISFVRSIRISQMDNLPAVEDYDMYDDVAILVRVLKYEAGIVTGNEPVMNF